MRPIRRKHREAGNAMVEFALATAILLPFFTGVFQFGYGFYTYNRIIAGVRTGARYASLLKYESTTSTPTVGFRDAVRNMVVFGNQVSGTQKIAPGLSPSQVNVSVAMVNGVPDMVTVSITSFTLDTVFKRFTFVNKPAATFRYEGLFAPM
jgi:Flp pilus assembly protein TadG